MVDWVNANRVWVAAAIAAAGSIVAAIWLSRRKRRRAGRGAAGRSGPAFTSGPPALTLEFSQAEFQNVPPRYKFVFLRNDGGMAREVQVGAISVGPYRAIFQPVASLGGGESVPLRIEVYEEGQMFSSATAGFENLLRHDIKSANDVLRVHVLISYRDSHGTRKTCEVCLNCNRPSMRLWVTAG